MAKAVFFIALILTCAFQWTKLSHRITDDSMWAHQASYFQSNDPEQYNFLMAYGHPGGPIITGTIFVHDAFGSPYLKSLQILMTILDSLAIAASCALCYMLKKDVLWWLPVFALLNFSQSYSETTPPSMLASLLVPLACLFTIYLYENREKASLRNLALWSALSGISIATRADIGVATTIAFAAILLPAVSWKKLAAMLAGSFAAFCFFDPFMWYMPLQHLKDLIFKITFHYADIAPSHITPFGLVSFSSLAFISMALGVALIIWRKKMDPPIPARALASVLVMTIALYTIFLTAHNQASRYFQPLIFIWEVFLPLFIFSLLPRIRFDSFVSPQGKERAQRAMRYFVLVLLVAGPMALEFYALSTFCKLDDCWIFDAPVNLPAHHLPTHGQ